MKFQLWADDRTLKSCFFLDFPAHTKNPNIFSASVGGNGWTSSNSVSHSHAKPRLTEKNSPFGKTSFTCFIERDRNKSLSAYWLNTKHSLCRGRLQNLQRGTKNTDSDLFFFLSAALHIFEEPCWQFTCQICLLCKSRFFILFIFLIYNLAGLKTQVYLFKSIMTTCETSHERYRRCNSQIKWSALWLSFFSFY